MASVYWTDKAEESLLEIGRYIIERTQSRQRGLDVINRILLSIVLGKMALWSSW